MSCAAPGAPWSWTWTSRSPAPGPCGGRRCPSVRTTSWGRSGTWWQAPARTTSAEMRIEAGGRHPSRASLPSMGDHIGRAPGPAAFDPSTTPVPRRRVLLLIGVGALAGAAGLGAVLEGCTPAPVAVELDVDPATLVPGTPVEVPFTVTINGKTVAGSAWLVRRTSGDLIAYDPRCTHALGGSD